MRSIFCIFCFVFCTHIVHAERIEERLGIGTDGTLTGGGQRKQSLLRKCLKFFPGGEAVGDVLAHLRKLAKKVMKTKGKIEEVYHLKKRLQRRAEFLSRNLKRGKVHNFLGALLEEDLGYPVNPAEYVPDTEYTATLKKNLEWDISLERGMLWDGSYMLQNTRAALIELGLVDKPRSKFEQEYQKAVCYEQKVNEALSAKRRAAIRLYKYEIDRLKKDVKSLEKLKTKEDLIIGEIMLVEQTIELKRNIMRALNEKITQGIEDALDLSDDQSAQLIRYKIDEDTKALEAYLAAERKKVHAQYEHLWRLW